MGFFKRKDKEQKLCPNCRKPVTDGSAFCDSCGLRVSPPPACAKCSLPLAPDTHFCEACGTPVGGVPPESQKSTDDEPASRRKGKSTKSRKGKRKTKPKKDEFVLPSMIIAVPAGEPPAAGLPVVQEPADAEKTAEKSVQEPEEEPGTTPELPMPDIPETGNAAQSPGTGVSRKTMIVAGIVVIGLIIVLAFMTGFMHISPPSLQKGFSKTVTPVQTVSVAVPGETMVSLTEQAVTSSTLVPGPTQVPPESYLIWLQAEREPITNMVTVIFNGGKGQRAVRDVQVRLTRSDGQVLTQVFKPLTVGEGAALQGTKFTDRLEVTVTYNNGNVYKVIDQVFAYKQRN
jgi:hypothetical protein